MASENRQWLLDEEPGSMEMEHEEIFTWICILAPMPIYRVSQKKCPIILKLSCLKYEHLIMGIMICLGRVILPACLVRTLFIWIFACMTE